MTIDRIGAKIYEVYKTQELDRQESLTKVMEPNSISNPFELEKRNHELLMENEKLIKKVKASEEIIDELGKSINRLLIKENRNLMTKLNNINKLLNDLYEAIDEHYTETLENNDGLAMVRAEAELKLITKILEEMEKT
nr:MAG TPA: hypothetical protein [Caudoviricetes sp.]